MTRTAHIVRTSLLAALTLTLLVASVPCASACATPLMGSTGSAAEADSAGESHCAKHEEVQANTGSDAPAEAPATPPCGEDCSGCSNERVSIPSSALSIDLQTHQAVAVLVWRTLSPSARRAAHTHPHHPLDRRPPPRDVLELTTTLLI